MPVRFLSDAQRGELAGFPRELDDYTLDQYFTLNGDDLDIVQAQRGDGNRLGWALQLCGLRMLGFCPDDLRSAPGVAVRFAARQIDVEAPGLMRYGRRAQTRTAHAARVREHLGFRLAKDEDLRSAEGWLAAQALEQDRPIVLFQLALRDGSCIRRPGSPQSGHPTMSRGSGSKRAETAVRRQRPSSEGWLICLFRASRSMRALPEHSPDQDVHHLVAVSAALLLLPPLDLHGHFRHV